jgi:hypothetical protein
MSWNEEWRAAVHHMTELEYAHDTHRAALGITGDKDDDQ